MPNIIEEVIRSLDAHSEVDGRTQGRRALSRAVRKYAAAVADQAKVIEVPEETAAASAKQSSPQAQTR